MEWKLNKVIVETNQCAKCSTCAIVCPNNLVKFDNKPYIEEECLRKGNGMCFEVCPRVSSGKYQIKLREKFKEEYYYAKSDIEGQDGGVVTAFLKYLLESGRIDGAIVVGDECWKPVSLIVQNAGDLLKAAKSKIYRFNLRCFKKGRRDGFRESGCSWIAMSN